MRNNSFLPFLCVLAFSLSAQEENQSEVAVVLTRSDSIPLEVQTATDPYFEGYIQALVDMHYAEYRVVVIVKNRSVWLANLPNNKLIANSIISFVKDVPGVTDVHEIDDGIPEKEED